MLWISVNNDPVDNVMEPLVGLVNKELMSQTGFIFMSNIFVGVRFMGTKGGCIGSHWQLFMCHDYKFQHQHPLP